MADRLASLPPLTSLSFEDRNWFEELVYGRSSNSIGTVLSGVRAAQATADANEIVITDISLTLDGFSPSVTVTAGIQAVADDVTDIETQLNAYYAISVDGGGNGALLRLSDNTALGSAIILSADEITLDGDAINLGANTEFETASDTFITETGGYRYRYGGPFGTSSDLLQWFGLDSVAQGSESKTNGVFALATDGKVYYGTAELLSSVNFTATYSASPINNAGAAADFSTATISINTAGLTGSKIYETAIIESSTLTPKVSVSSATAVSFTLDAAGFAVSESETGTVRTLVTDVTTGRTTSVQAAYSMTRTS